MIRKALEYIVGLNKPTLETLNGQMYSDKELHRISYNPKAAAIEMSTLSSFVEYIKSGIDGVDCSNMIIHVVSPTCVKLFSPLDNERKREILVEVNAKVPDFSFNNFLDHEKFCINLQSKFIDTPDKALVMKFAGTVESGTVADYGDDGVTQKATIKTGLASKTEAVVPSPAQLKPYRTFVEVDQPISSYIFRMKQEKYDGIQCALFEADGGAWKIKAMESIKFYLMEQLTDFPEIIIIA